MATIQIFSVGTKISDEIFQTATVYKPDTLPT